MERSVMSSWLIISLEIAHSSVSVKHEKPGAWRGVNIYSFNTVDCLLPQFGIPMTAQRLKSRNILSVFHRYGPYSLCKPGLAVLTGRAIARSSFRKARALSFFSEKTSPSINRQLVMGVWFWKSLIVYSCTDAVTPAMRKSNKIEK